MFSVKNFVYISRSKNTKTTTNEKFNRNSNG